MNNLRIPRTENAKFSEYYFYLSMDIYGDFQICISVPLKNRKSERKVYLQMRSHATASMLPLHSDNLFRNNIGNLYFLKETIALK